MNSDRPDPELSEADRLLAKADALLSRYRKPENTSPEEEREHGDEDLPIVTEVVDIPLEDLSTRPPMQDMDAGVERLVELDTAINLAIEQWLADELPILIRRELDGLAERLHAETVGHLRATLIPRLSAELAERLDEETPFKRR